MGSTATPKEGTDGCTQQIAIHVFLSNWEDETTETLQVAAWGLIAFDF